MNEVKAVADLLTLVQEVEQVTGLSPKWDVKIKIKEGMSVTEMTLDSPQEDGYYATVLDVCDQYDLAAQFSGQVLTLTY